MQVSIHQHQWGVLGLVVGSNHQLLNLPTNVAYPMTDPWLPGIPTYTFTIKINPKCIGRYTSPMDPS